MYYPYSNIKLNGSFIEAKAGHCYVVKQDTYTNSSNLTGTSVIAVFHVEKVAANDSIEINEIEVFNRATIVNQS